jgi:hypothetical protein
MGLLVVALHEHQVDGQVLGDGPLYHVVFTDRPIQTYRDLFKSNTYKLNILHNVLLENMTLK